MFAPTRFLRHANALLQVALQLVIMATGNYGFFNLLTMALCVPLIDDSVWSALFKVGDSEEMRRLMRITAIKRGKFGIRFAVRFVVYVEFFCLFC